MPGLVEVPLGYILAGVIWAVALGLAAGNYVTTAVCRIPKQEPLFIRRPYCDACDTLLKTPDLFPFFSWVFSRGRCRYCHAAIPVIYTVIEAVATLLFVLTYLEYNYSEEFILLISLFMAVLTWAGIEASGHVAPRRVFFALLALCILYRVWQDVTIYGFLRGMAVGGALAVAIWRWQSWRAGRDVPFLDAGWWWIVGGAALHPYAFALYVLLGLAGMSAAEIFSSAVKPVRVLASVIYGSILVVLLLYPAMADIVGNGLKHYL